MPSFGHKGNTTMKGNIMLNSGFTMPNTASSRWLANAVDYLNNNSAAQILSDIKGAASNAATQLKDYFQSGSGSGSGSGGSAPAPVSPFTIKDGKVTFTDPNMQAAMLLMNQQTEANNTWSAEQAQKQMDFQREMSNTAHQREVADLQAAGLNPVLSAGGSGAQVTSGAMAQTDTGNTRMIADLAMAALDAISNTAVGVAGAGGSGRKGLLDNYYVKRVLGYGASELGRQVIRSFFY